MALIFQPLQPRTALLQELCDSYQGHDTVENFWKTFHSQPRDAQKFGALDADGTRIHAE